MHSPPHTLQTPPQNKCYIKHDGGVIYFWIMNKVLKREIFFHKNGIIIMTGEWKYKLMTTQEHIWVWWKYIQLPFTSRLNYQMLKYDCNWLNSIIDE